MEDAVVPPLIDNGLETKVVEVWRREGYSDSTIAHHLSWIRRYRRHVQRTGRGPSYVLTRLMVVQFLKARHRRRSGAFSTKYENSAKAAVKAWTRGLSKLGFHVLPWISRGVPSSVDNLLLAEYCEFQRRQRGVRDSSMRVECRYVRGFLATMRSHHRSLRQLGPGDIDGFLIPLGRRVASKTLSVACTSIRCFLRFLHLTKRTSLATVPVSVSGFGPPLS
jgi:integrase/recombinase XerD